MGKARKHEKLEKLAFTFNELYINGYQLLARFREPRNRLILSPRPNNRLPSHWPPTAKSAPAPKFRGTPIHRRLEYFTIDLSDLVWYDLLMLREWYTGTQLYSENLVLPRGVLKIWTRVRWRYDPPPKVSHTQFYETAWLLVLQVFKCKDLCPSPRRLTMKIPHAEQTWSPSHDPALCRNSSSWSRSFCVISNLPDYYFGYHFYSSHQDRSYQIIYRCAPRLDFLHCPLSNTPRFLRWSQYPARKSFKTPLETFESVVFTRILMQDSSNLLFPEGYD